MPTSHRAKKRASPSLRGLALAVIALIGLAAVAYFVIGLVTGGPDHSSGSGTSSPTADASVRPSDPPSPSETASPSPQGQHAGAPSVARVPASPPHALSIGSVITDAPFGTAVSPTSGRLVPDAPEQLQRLGDRGIPGSPGTDTVVVVGASSTSGRGALDGIDGVRRGQRIVLQTQNARLTYQVTGVQDVDPMKVLSLPVVKGKHTDRLVVDCAHYTDSNRAGKDRVLVARLVKAQSMRP